MSAITKRSLADIELEIEAIRLIVRAMDSLSPEPEAQIRVLRWACDRYLATPVERRLSAEMALGATRSKP